MTDFHSVQDFDNGVYGEIKATIVPIAGVGNLLRVHGGYIDHKRAVAFHRWLTRAVYGPQVCDPPPGAKFKPDGTWEVP